MAEWQKAAEAKANSELYVLAVDESYRITLPKLLCDRVPWIGGDQPIGMWLLVGGPGRCRLLSMAEAENQPALRSLAERIAAELNSPGENPIEFHDDASTALPFRLAQVEAMPRGLGWRLAFPRAVAAIMGIRAKGSEIAAMLRQEHIELWALETLRSATLPPLTEIL
jgi:hypothetical protein